MIAAVPEGYTTAGDFFDMHWGFAGGPTFYAFDAKFTWQVQDWHAQFSVVHNFLVDAFGEEAFGG